MTLVVRRARPEDQLACAQVFVETVAATFPDEPEEGEVPAPMPPASSAKNSGWLSMASISLL